MLLIALAVIWLACVAFVLTMCRLAARTDATSHGREADAARVLRQPRRAARVLRVAQPAERRPSRSSLRVK